MAKTKGIAGKTLIKKSLRTFFFGSDKAFASSAKGMKGERLLGKALSQLPEGWRIWHDLDIGGENIDHLVASAKGVFIVEVKNYRGTSLALPKALYTHGSKKPNHDIPRQVWRQVYKLKDVLGEVYISPLLVFVNGVNAGDNVTGLPVTTNIPCLSLEQLVPHLRDQDNRLSYAEAKPLFAQLDALTK
ncbi:MAG: nuclease-related domain-containing protein [Deinococcota bacterium]